MDNLKNKYMAIYNQFEATELNQSNNALVIMLPFAGGNMYSCKNITNEINSKFDIYCPELPGRGELHDVSLINNINDLAQNIFLNSIKKIRLNKQYILYGHSMGGLLAYLISKLIMLENLPLPIRIIVSGREGPSAPREEISYRLPKSEFYDKLRSLGGISAEILTNNELMEYFEPIFRSDFQAVETYEYSTPDKILNIPITSLYGTEEGLSLEGIHKWEIETTGKTNYVSFPGNHFFIFNNSKKIAHIIEDSFYEVSK